MRQEQATGPRPDPGLPVVRVTPHQAKVNEQAKALLEAHQGVYVRGGRLSWVVQGVRGEVPRVVDLERHMVGSLLTEVATWRHKRGDKVCWVDPPAWCVGYLLEERHWGDEARQLEGVTETPCLRPDGTVLVKQGYDPMTGLYLAGEVDLGLEALLAPTLEDARNAVEQLLEVVVDFPFQRPEDRSVWLAFVLTLFARPAIEGYVPLFIADANVAGSGKSKLIDLGHLIATGREASRVIAPRDEEEWGKVVMGQLLASAGLVLFDNLSGELGSDALDAVLTTLRYTGRVLGTPEMRTVPARTVWAATGNNVQLRGDLRRRTLRLRLDSQVERPEERSAFRHPDVLAWVRRERPRLATAALTVLRAYVVAGRPTQEGRWGSYEAWHALVRGALVWAGQPDPDRARDDLAQQSDPTTVAFRALLLSWRDLWGSQRLHVSQITSRLTPGPGQELGEALASLRAVMLELCPGPQGGMPSPLKLGKMLARFKERPGPEGLRLHGEPDRKGVVQWWVHDPKALE